MRGFLIFIIAFGFVLQSGCSTAGYSKNARAPASVAVWTWAGGGQSLAISDVERTRYAAILDSAFTRIKQYSGLTSDEAFRVQILIDPSWSASGAMFVAAADAGISPTIIIQPKIFLDPITAQRLLIHEWAHRVHYHFRPNEEDWVREGVALEIEHQISGVYSNSIRESFEPGPFSLTDPISIHQRLVQSKSAISGRMGTIALFFDFLNRNVSNSSANIIKKLWLDPSVEIGTFRVNEAIQQVSSEVTFKGLWLKFIQAKVNPTGIGNDGFVLPFRMNQKHGSREVVLPPYSFMTVPGPCQKDEVTVSRRSRICLRLRGD